MFEMKLTDEEVNEIMGWKSGGEGVCQDCDLDSDVDDK